MKKLLLVFAKSNININISQSDLNKHETQVLKLQMWMIPQIIHSFEESVLLFYLLEDNKSEKIPQTSTEEELEPFLHTSKNTQLPCNCKPVHKTP